MWFVIVFFMMSGWRVSGDLRIFSFTFWFVDQKIHESFLDINTSERGKSKIIQKMIPDLISNLFCNPSCNKMFIVIDWSKLLSLMHYKLL